MSIAFWRNLYINCIYVNEATWYVYVNICISLVIFFGKCSVALLYTEAIRTIIFKRLQQEVRLSVIYKFLCWLIKFPDETIPQMIGLKS